ANRDVSVFPDGEQMDVGRDNARRSLSFGFGSHMCLGAPIARMELAALLQEFSSRLPHMRLAPQEISYSPINVSFRGPERLQVVWDPAANPRPEDRPVDA
ncbi:MAG: cytochrome P450, partial [Pseudomonadota bacterium]